MNRKMSCFPIALAAALLGACHARADDQEEIKARTLDYIEGWYEGSVERVTRALHPEFVKKGILEDNATGKSNFGLHSATTLIEAVRQGRGKKYPKASRQIRVTVLDVGKAVANVKVTCGLSREYLHLVKFNGKWRIIHVLFEFL